MAFVQNQDQTQDQNQQQNPMAQAPVTSAGAGGATSTAGGASPQGAPSQPTSTKTPPVQDLKAYLAANAPQAVQMGQNIAGNLNQQAQTVTGDINAAKQDVANQVQAQNIAPNTDLVNQAASNPTEFVQNPDNLKDFLAQENANYTGPTNFETTPQYSNLTAEVQNAQQNAPDINKPGGVEQLVRVQETNPTLGMSNLDTLLLQGTPEAMVPIQGALPQFKELPTALTSAGTDINAQIQQAIANDQAAKAGVQNAFLTGKNAVVPAFQNELNTRLQGDVNAVNTYNQGLNDLISKENAVNPDIQAVRQAIDAYNSAGRFSTDRSGQLPSISGIDLTPKNPNAITSSPTLAQIATPADIAKEEALIKLLGTGFTEPITDKTQVGSFKNPGTAPTIADILNSPLNNLQGQITPIVEEINNPAEGAPAFPYSNGPAQFINLQDALQKLQAAIGKGA